MGSDSEDKHSQLIKFFRANFTLVMSGIALIGMLFILGGVFIPSSSAYLNQVLRQALSEIGTAIFVGATVSVVLSEYYRRFRELSTRAELTWMLEELKDIIRDPSEFFDLRDLISLKKANVLTFYQDRKGPAIQDLRSKLESLSGTTQEVEVCILGNTLRVFFHPHTEFTDLIIGLITKKMNVKFKVLITNPNSLTAFYRSWAETTSIFKDDKDYWQRSAFIADSERTRHQIEGFNRMARDAYKCKGIDECKATSNKCRAIDECKVGTEHESIQLRYYDCADTCLVVLFPDMCYTSQYTYGDEKAQVHTVGLPMIKFSADSEHYKRLKRHFDYVWDISVEYSDVEKSKKVRPVVKALYDTWKSMGINNRFLPVSSSPKQLVASPEEDINIDPPTKQ